MNSTPEQVEKIGGSIDGLTTLLEGHGFDSSELVDKEDITSNIKAVRPW